MTLKPDAQNDSNLAAKLKHYRLSRDEYDRITLLLGRPPEGVEWALFSSLWTEHCSYKSSRVHLKKLFNKSPRVLMSFGENAGVFDLGQGERIAFKIESHNHPSFIEPYEGAATGVGGILRDIFAMGARPIALANYLAFGDVSHDSMTEARLARMPALIDGVVRGIGGYGNCVGVPTITGQTAFHSSYNKNILVNALALGLFREGDPVFSARATGVGNLVVYVGAKTGKDGVHGASMASESFDDDSKNGGESKKPTIQKGDPFYEKLLIESCLEVMRERLVVAVQDMGAAGLTSSTFEMAARGGVGFKIDLDRVPLRDVSMTPEEILLSESQERMLLIVTPENFERLKAVFARWSLDAEIIGSVTGQDVELYWHGELICKIDPKILVDEAPRIERPYDAWSVRHKAAPGISAIKPADVGSRLLQILASPQGSSRSWIFRQYDQRVGTKTIFDCEESVGVVRLPDSKRSLGLVLGGRPHVMRLDAHIGGIDSVAYPALELAAKGFLPLAVTDGLNFGNPENRDVMSEFVASLDGLNEQALRLATPIISGNVSFYNETLGSNITSTIATGIVGLRDTIEDLPRSFFRSPRDELYLVETQQLVFSDNEGVGELECQKVADFINLIRHLALVPAVRSSRVVGKFGLPYALARMCNKNMGASVQWKPPVENGWFTESLYQVIFAVDPDGSFNFRQLYKKLAANLDFNISRLGEVRPAVRSQSREGAENAEATLEIGKVIVPVSQIDRAYNTPWEVLFGLS